MLLETYDIIRRKLLIIEPFDEIQVLEEFVLLRIGKNIKYEPEEEISYLNIGDSIVIQPYENIVLTTLESIHLSPKIYGMIELRKQISRQGLILVTYPFIDPGYIGKLSFVLYNAYHLPSILYSGVNVVELSLFDNAHPRPSRPAKRKTNSNTNLDNAPLINPEIDKLKSWIINSNKRVKVEPKLPISELLESAINADKKNKGKLLEYAVCTLLSSINGFKIIKQNAKLLSEEIDIILRNNVADGFLKPFVGNPIIVECKNWSKKVDTKEISILFDKMKAISPDVKLGILIAVNGVTGDFKSNAKLKIREKRQTGTYILVLTKNDIQKIIEGEHILDIIERKYDEVLLI